MLGVWTAPGARETRKSAFRAGFWPDCYQESTEIGPLAAPHGKYVWFGVLCEHLRAFAWGCPRSLCQAGKAQEPARTPPRASLMRPKKP